jgi:hypothetical protein
MQPQSYKKIFLDIYVPVTSDNCLQGQWCHIQKFEIYNM